MNAFLIILSVILIPMILGLMFLWLSPLPLEDKYYQYPSDRRMVFCPIFNIVYLVLLISIYVDKYLLERIDDITGFNIHKKEKH